MEPSTLLNVDHNYSSSSESDSDEGLLTSNLGTNFHYPQTNQRFLDQTRMSSYESERNSLFTKPIYTKCILLDTHSLPQTSSFNYSNYKVSLIDNRSDSPYHNVIGFRLLTANIRNNVFNVNTNNNKIYYTITTGSDHTTKTITINPGQYTLTQLASVFTDTTITKSHHVTYSDFGSGYFTVTYAPAKHSSSNQGHVFTFTHSAGGSTIEFQWDTDNVSRSAAKLLGFLPVTSSTANHVHTSDKAPDLSLHHVDLVIPEIPDIACKRNSYGKEVIQRILMNSPIGDYQTFINTDSSDHPQNFFYPISLSSLTIQLYSENNEFLYSHKSDNGFEFELTMLRNHT